MRVISGRFKGFQLSSAKTGTRPTTDRTKEAIFSHLDSWGVLDDARVLDLFAGTGALGIEALSRGAVSLVAVEFAGPAAAALSKTIASLKSSKAWRSGMQARAMRAKAESFAAGYAGDPFNVIFIDPPYAMTTEAVEALLNDIITHGVAVGPSDSAAAEDDTVIVLERSARSAEPTPPEGWRIIERRDYGETAVYYLDGRVQES